MNSQLQKLCYESLNVYSLGSHFKHIFILVKQVLPMNNL